MLRASRFRRSRLLSAIALASSALFLAPPPALADDDWDDDDRYERPWRHHHGRGRGHQKHHDHGEWCAPRYDRRGSYQPRYYEPRPHRYYEYRRPVRQARYHCEPCDHWYRDEPAFRRHVHHHHGVPLAVLPLVILATVFGAVFAGH